MSQISTAARGAVNAFFDWWLAELAGLIPPGLQPARRRRRRLLVLALGAEDAALFRGTGARRRLLARSPSRDPEQLKPLIRKSRGRRRQAIVRLPPQQGLHKTIELPLAAKQDLNQLLRFEMDRLTPFRAEEVLFAHRVVSTDAHSRRMTVEIQLAPKPVVETALDQARRAGLVPVGVELGDTEPLEERALDLLPGRQTRAARTGRLNRALALLALLLAAAAVAIPLHERRSTAADLQAQLAVAKAEAEDSLALRQRLEKVSASSDFLAAEKTRVPMAGLILAEVTRVLPDQAYLARLDWRDGTLQLEGFAEAAAALVGLLDRSPMFQAPQFRSPVTPDRRTELERFHVALELSRDDH
jgi:general secretion pathway protein L